jgi:hypothetical protein
MREELTIQRFAMHCKAHGAESPRQYMLYGKGVSTAQRSNARKEWIEEMARVG